MRKAFFFPLFVIIALLLPSSASAADKRADCSPFSTNPQRITTNSDFAEFTFGAGAFVKEGRKYQVEVQIPTTALCRNSPQSSFVEASSRGVSARFENKTGQCHDIIFKEGTRFVNLREEGSRDLLCTSTYTVTEFSTCQLTITGDNPQGPGKFDTDTNLTISATGVPQTYRSHVLAFKISGPVARDRDYGGFTTGPGGNISRNIEKLGSVSNNYQLELINTENNQVIRECTPTPIRFAVGPPGQPVDNQIGQPSTPSGEVARASEPLKCGPGDKGINTALGCIPVGSTNEFVGWFLRWAIGIAGGVAFILMLIAAFQIMTAAGNPERLQGGRELLNAAVSGLILIIFSVFLLKLIGFDILALPGFGK